jgi:D-lactate dehydrogenase (cytochrome)
LSELTTLLSSALGDSGRVTDGESDRDLHSRDVALFTPVRPDVVVYPETTEEVARVLALADERRIPVTPFGIGSSLEGHVIPIAGGISLDLTRMSRILSIEP